jgi:hypothetical protein
VKPQFVKTSNYERLMKGFRQAENRGAPEATFIFVHGHPGVGKTRLMEDASIEQKWLWLRADKGWTPSSFLRALAQVLKVDTACRPDKMFQRCLEAMARLGFPPIAIDEVQHCEKDNFAVIQRVRDFSDRTKSPVFLVAGSLGVWEKFSRVEELVSRVSAVVALEPYEQKDVQATFDALCEVTVTADVAARVTGDSKGLSRLIANAIKNVEAFAATNGLTTVTAKDLTGVPLCIDWQAEIGKQALARRALGPSLPVRRAS